MAYGKFAPMTSALLTRKGEAAPSTIAGTTTPNGIGPVTVGFFDRPAKPAAPAPVSPKATTLAAAEPTKRASSEPKQAKTRRVVVAVSQEEFERLGIAAVKKDVTRQELVRAALSRYLGKTASMYSSCQCIAPGAKRASE